MLEHSQVRISAGLRGGQTVRTIRRNQHRRAAVFQVGSLVHAQRGHLRGAPIQSRAVLFGLEQLTGTACVVGTVHYTRRLWQVLQLGGIAVDRLSRRRGVLMI